MTLDLFEIGVLLFTQEPDLCLPRIALTLNQGKVVTVLEVPKLSPTR